MQTSARNGLQQTKTVAEISGKGKEFVLIKEWCRPFQTNSPVCRAAFADIHRPADSRRRQPAVLTGLPAAINQHLWYIKHLGRSPPGWRVGLTQRHKVYHQ